MLGIHVHDRNLESLREIARIMRRPAVDRISRESDLVVDDDVKRSADAISAEPRHVERLRHNALAGKRGIAVDAHREHTRSSRHSLPSELTCRARATPCRTGFTNSRWLGFGISATSTSRPLGDFRVPVAPRWYFTSPVSLSGIRCGVLPLELPEDRPVRLAEHVSENVDASAVRHRDARLPRALRRGRLDRDVEHRNQDVRALDRESLVALIHPAKESLESVDFGEPSKNGFLLFDVSGS